MRTTLTLDADVAERIRALAHLRQLTFKDAVNMTLRRGLDGPDALDDGAYEVVPHHGGFLPGVDPARLNQLLDELEVDDFIHESSE